MCDMWLAILWLSLWPLTAVAIVACNDTHNPCSDLLWEGSECIDGFCTNPFQGGCLRPLLESPEYELKYNNDDTEESIKTLRRRILNKPRACNSEDGPKIREKGICIPSENGYEEVRVYAQNWEAAFILAWMLQIVYSELLGVPSTIESGAVDKNVNFYSQTNRMDYGTGNDFKVIQNAYNADGGDCTVYKKENVSEEEYKPCANIAVDLWSPETWAPAVESQYGEATKLIGIVAVQTWYITQFSIKGDQSLATYHGLSGEENRRKLAETFKRPTTWIDYCTLISTSNCTVADEYAQRAPTEEEENKYFMEGLYTGFFRATAANDCDANPTSCTGHFIDYPCGWTSYFKQQAYHLEIALENDGPLPHGKYSYSDLVDLWHAANATKSNLIGIWWEPDATFSNFIGSGADLTQVALPPTTIECLANRINVAQRCDMNLTPAEMYGNSLGACAEPYISTLKIAASNFESSIKDHPDAKARMSPAYGVYQDFTSNSAVINDILTNWVSRGIDKYGFDLRLATCKWMADNLELIDKSLIPPSHPRVLVVSEDFALTVAAVAFATIAIITTLVTTGSILYKHKKGTLGRMAQMSFLLLLLIGLFMVSVGGFLKALEPSTGTCVASMWFIFVGYTLQMVPTLIRVSAIIKILRYSRRMRTVKVDKKKLVRMSIGLSLLSAVYCLLWTIFDTPQQHSSLEVTQHQNELAETIVNVQHYCDSDSSIWQYAAFVFQALLLISASVLAFQMRQAPNSVNDSKPLAFMIYTSFFFLTLRFVLFVVSESVSGVSMSLKSPLQKSSSIFISLDTIVNIGIFFSQFFIKDDSPQNDSWGTSRITAVDRLRNNIQQRHATEMITSSELESSDVANSSSVIEKQPVANFIPPRNSLASSANETNGSLQKLQDQDSPPSMDNTSYRRRSSAPDASTRFSFNKEPSNIKFAAEEKAILNSDGNPTTVRIRMNGECEMIDVPQWVIEEYGSKVKHN